MNELQRQLFAMKDLEYKEFQAQMLPTVEYERFIGIRSTSLSKIARNFFTDKTREKFLEQLPHKYFEEDLIHAKIISEIKDFDKCVDAIEKFLPYVDNWSVCDSIIPKVFAVFPDALAEEIENWIESDQTYTVRFAIFMLMKFHLKKNFHEKYLKWVADLRTDDYYIEMMAAWFFTEALVERYKYTIPYLEKNLIAKKIHTKTLQKALDSKRIPDSTKEYLKTLRGRRV